VSQERYVVRPARREDAEAIARFQVALAQESEGLRLKAQTVRRGVRHIFTHPERGRYLVAADARGQVVGCLLVLKEWSDWRNREVWWIHSAYVAPAHRRRGVLRRLFARAAAMARRCRAAGLRLYVARDNRRARTVYRRLGLTAEHYALYEKMF